jgi:dTDP-4-amino-4,6-dideoxygalactose transaminase
MQRLGTNETHRRGLSDYYSKVLCRAGWASGDVPGGERATLLRYPLRVANKATLLEKARDAGIELGSWFETPLHPLSLSQHHHAFYEMGSCPVAEATAASVVNLPLHDRVSRAEAEKIIRFVFARAIAPRAFQSQPT